jgi:hypothetical protein
LSLCHKTHAELGEAANRLRSHRAVIRACDDAGNVIETHDHRAISKSRSGRFSSSN